MQTREEMNPAEAYKATLSQLSSSSKPEINALTMLADDYRDYAISIVACIENQLKTADIKLPVMYLIDSICKNFPKSRYVELFTQNIVSNFCYVFQVSDEKVRKSLHKLRMTWETMKIFPQRKLEAIDDRVHKIDPNWPILRKLTASQRKQPQPQPQPPPQPQSQSPAEPILVPQPQPLPQPILVPQPQPPPQPQSQSPAEPILVPQTFIDPNIMQATHDISQVHPNAFMDPSIAILESLYGGKQCSNCSLRFDDNNRYAIHLDWHFRQNLKTDTVFARRKWYYPLELWVQFREINDDDLKESDNADTATKDILLSVNDYEVPTAPASKEDEKNICSVCHETFEKFWAEEEEEWRLRNAKMYQDDRVYHPLCLMDMLQASATAVQSCG